MDLKAQRDIQSYSFLEIAPKKIDLHQCVPLNTLAAFGLVEEHSSMLKMVMTTDQDTQPYLNNNFAQLLGFVTLTPKVFSRSLSLDKLETTWSFSDFFPNAQFE